MPSAVEIPEPPRSQGEVGDSAPGKDRTPDSKPFTTSFLDHLVSRRMLSREVAVELSRMSQERKRKSLVDILIEEFSVDPDMLYDEVARFYSFRTLSLAESTENRLGPIKVGKMLSELPEKVFEQVRRHRVLPFEVDENQPEKILLATPNPIKREVHQVARAFALKKFEICYMKEADWEEFWRQVTMKKQVSVAALDEMDENFEPEEDIDSMLNLEMDRGRLIALLESIFADAVRVGASDIHIYPKGIRHTSISFRIDGQLNEWYAIEDVRAEAVIAVAKGRGIGLDRFERMMAQDGSAQKVVDDQIIRFRMSVLPVISREIGGKLESLVIRILRDADASVSLETIGFDPYSMKWFSESIARPQGMVILTGPTGCGKSTTLIAALRSVMKPSLNTITVEDPVEYLIEGARQVKLNPKLSFDDAMRAILRHDPDIVMVGEIRDHITADIAIKLANTGHLTFSTLHTNDAPSAISRLFKIGVEPFLISQALNIVVAQRLLRRLCLKCRRPLDHPDDTLLARLGFTQEDADEASFYQAIGCQNCVGGYKGRMAIHESLFVTAELREIISDSNEKVDTDLIRATAMAHGMQTLRESGLQLVKKGLTTIEEVASMTVQE